MISSAQALSYILENTPEFGTEEVSMMQSQDRVLKETVVADRDFPPFDRVSMDGIAIKYESFESGTTHFNIEAIQAAGDPAKTLNNTAGCIEVMTGSVLPKNCDTVIRYEDLKIENKVASLTIEELKKGQNVHPQGSDRAAADVLIRKNTLIGAAEIGVLSTVGKTKIVVAKQPQVMIISTGDELVDVDQVPETHQIRRSNVYTLISLLKSLGLSADSDHINDNYKKLKERISMYLDRYDVLLLSGAVSKGKFDFLPKVLDELGVEKKFHKVAQRPGKPFWYGVKDATHIFAFPGNPVSTFVGCLKYFFPWYRKSLQLPYDVQGKAILGEDLKFKPALTYFLQVKLDVNGGLKIAKPVTGNGSGDLANLVEVDGFLELPADKDIFISGETYPLIQFRR